MYTISHDLPQESFYDQSLWLSCMEHDDWRVLLISLGLSLTIRKAWTRGLVRQEITLREGQANNRLHAIRVHLVDEAVLFKTTVWQARSQATTTTRAWSEVRSVEHIININSTIYKKCWTQMSNWTLDVQDESVSNDWMNECEWYSPGHQSHGIQLTSSRI